MRIKHLEDSGDLNTNVTAIKDSLVASVRVTNGAELCIFYNNTGLRIDGWTELNLRPIRYLTRVDLQQVLMILTRHGIRAV